MTYSLSTQNETQDLLARITRDLSARQASFAGVVPNSTNHPPLSGRCNVL